MNIKKFDIKKIKNKSKIYIYNDSLINGSFYNNLNEIKILVNHIIEKRNLNYGTIINESSYDFLDSIIKLEKNNTHKNSYILFKNYNVFLNNININNKKKYMYMNLNNLLENEYNIKIFLINDLNIKLDNDSILLLNKKNYKKFYEKFNIKIKNVINYEYIILNNEELYYYNLTTNTKKRNYIENIDSSDNDDNSDSNDNSDNNNNIYIKIMKKKEVNKKRNNFLVYDSYNIDLIETNMKKLKIDNNKLKRNHNFNEKSNKKIRL